MKRIVLVISNRKQGNASGFIEEFSKLNGKIDKIICLHVKHDLIYYFKKVIKLFKIFGPQQIKYSFVLLISKINGMQFIKNISINWKTVGENSWDLLNHGMDIFEFARENNIPLEFVKGISKQVIQSNAKEPTLFVMYNGGIISNEILEINNAELLNAHMGEMPVYRGVNVIEWAVLENNIPKVTLMIINKQIDGGDIIYSVVIPSGKEKTIAELRKLGYIYCYKAMAIGTYNYQRNNSLRIKQPSGAKYYYQMHPFIRKLLSDKLMKSEVNTYI